MGGAIRPNITQAGTELRNWLIRRDFNNDLGRSEECYIFGKRFSIKDEAHPIINALVGRLLAGNARSHPFTNGHAGIVW